MKQTAYILKLLDFTQNDHPFGNVQGKKVFSKLADQVDALPAERIFGISLEGIVATDASFPRESVLSLAKQHRGEKGFFLIGEMSRDLFDNWKYAAEAKDQPLVIWHDNEFDIIGPKISPSTKTLIDYVLTKREVTASKVARGLDISVQNASTKLKKLVSQGYIMRSEEVAESGGIEYIYHAINQF